jgi:hypothetical protein
MKSQKIIISIIALIFLSSLMVTAQDKFSESECVTRWTKEVDAPFRLKRANAIKRCNTIMLRIETMSKQILGKWQLKGTKGRKVTLEFLADGTSRSYWYESATRKSGSSEDVWAIVNPYGTIGSEVIQFNDEYLREIKISGATMTITSTPTSSYNSDVERWKRIK